MRLNFLRSTNDARRANVLDLYHQHLCAVIIRTNFALRRSSWAKLAKFCILFAALLSTFAITSPANAQSPNPIEIENQQQGSTDWSIGRFDDGITSRAATDVGKQIKGYASATSVNIGESIDLYISVDVQQIYTIDIYRLGWYDGSGSRLMTSIGPLNGQPQIYSAPDPQTGLIEYSWDLADGYTLNIPTDWTSGMYLAKLTNSAGWQNYIRFVVRDDARTADLLYQQPVTTDLAYNNFPDDGATGKSTYNYNSHGPQTVAMNTRAVKVSFDRPMTRDGLGHSFRYEIYLIRWLERMGYDVAYATNLDVHEDGLILQNYRAFISPGHDEYWTAEMFTAAEDARDAGVNLAFFGSNSVYWQVRFEPSTAGVASRIMVSYKDSSIDPITTPGLKTVRFRNAGREEQQLVGVQYITFNASASNNTAFVPQNLDHWIYNDAGFVSGDQSGQNEVAKIVGYEVDQTDPNYPHPQNLSYTTISASPFTGQYGSVVTAHGSIYQALSRAWVFAGGTMSWSWALDLYGYTDPRIQATTVNILNRFIDGEPPLVTNPGKQLSMEEEVVSLFIEASDSGIDTLAYSAIGLPPGLSINSATGEIFGTIDDRSSASYNVTVSVTDGVHTEEVVLAWKVLSVNQIPLITSPGEQTNFELDIVSLAISATDADDEALTFSASDLPSGLAIGEATGQISGTIDSGANGAYSIVVTATDGIADAVTSFTWTVNEIVDDAPIITTPDAQTNSEGENVSLAIQANDPEGSSLTYNATDLPENLSINSNTGLISGQLSLNSSGVYSITLAVSDTIQSVSTSFVWTILDVNQVPILTNPGSQADDEGETIALQITIEDRDGDLTNLAATGLPSGLTVDGLSGQIVGTLGPTSAGTYDVTLTASDDDDSISTTFVWTVNAVNQPPTIDEVPNQVNDSGQMVSLQVTGIDPDLDALLYSASGLLEGLSINAESGLITGTIPIAEIGNFNVFVTVDDGAFTATTDFVWTVNETDVPPILTQPAEQASSEGEAISLTIEADDPNASALIYSAVGLPNGLTLNPTNGIVSGNLPFDSAGVYTVTVLVDDGSLTDEATFNWTVEQTNQPPTLINPGLQNNDEGDTVLLTFVASDLDDDLLVYSGTGLPESLRIESSNGTITGTIGALTAGRYNVEVSVNDGIDSTSRSFIWIVNSTNQPPALQELPDRLRTEGDVVSVPISAMDPDGDLVTFNASGLPPGLSINTRTGEVYGVVSAGSAGLYTVEITISDGLLTDTSEFMWTIIESLPPPNQSPIIDMLNAHFHIVGDIVDLTVTASDPDNDPLTFSATGLPDGLDIDEESGGISGLVTTAGTYNTTITVSDGNGGADSVAFDWIISATGNNAPIANAGPDQAVVDADNSGAETVTLDGTASSDSDGSIETYVWSGVPNITIPNGPTPSFDLPVGSYTILLTVIDNGGATATDSVDISINAPANSAPALDPIPAQSNLVGDIVDLSATASDVDNDTLVFSATNLPAGIILDTATGSMTGSPSSAGSSTVTVSVDDGNGGTDSTSFLWTVTQLPLECGPLQQEAEDGLLFGAFDAIVDPTASNGQYITTDTSVPSEWVGADGVNYAEYCVTVPAAGDYLIKTTSAAQGQQADSFYVQIDGAPASGYLWDTPQGANFANGYVGDRNGMNPVEVSLVPGDYTITFSMRESGTKLDKFELERIGVVEPPVGSCNGLTREAEDGILADGAFDIITDGSASGGAYITSPEDSGDEWVSPNGLRRADYCFTVDDAGTYLLEGIVAGPDDLSDSFYVRIDGEPAAGFLWDTALSTTFVADNLRNRFGANPVLLDLDTGIHTVTIYVREDGAKLDKLTLKLDEIIIEPPTICTGLTREAEDAQLSGGFTIGTDLNASNGQYIFTPDTGADEWNGPNPQRRADFCFTADQPGTYQLSTLVAGQDTDSDSFYVRVNDAPARGHVWDTPLDSVFTQDYVSDRNVADPVTVVLPAGENIVSVYVREEGTYLDSVTLEFVSDAMQLFAVENRPSGPPVARGLSGMVLVQSASGAVNRDAVDFTQFSISVRDAETNGQAYTETKTLGAAGSYRFDNISSGDYLFTLNLPDNYESMMPETIPVSITNERAVQVSPDVMQIESESTSYNYLPVSFAR